ncbi:MAG: lamin tail domain-containing protein [Pirellulales bacterium]|nr:lamin tail domain-containing protein [Pirellulales bacterium]
MSFIRSGALGVCFAVMFLPRQNVVAQVVINEIVDDERAADSTQVSDTREFIELYNAGNSAVDISGWTLKYWQLGAATGAGSYFGTTDTIQAGTLLASHDYFVIGANGVPNLDLDLGANIDLFPDSTTAIGGTIFELWNGATLIDAVGMETYRNQELANADQAQLDQIAFGQTAGSTPRGGWWGQTLSNNANAPNVPQSLSRFTDGLDRNVNGRDLGMLPITPGATNNLPQNAAHTIANVDSTAVGTELATNYYASFVLPRVIDPTTVGPAGGGGNNINTTAVPASPQGGLAIIAYDETGGGNAVYSKELVNEFSLYAYIETADLNLGQTAVQSEASTYGIGSTDPFFGTPNQAGLNTLTSTQNGNTGIGWLVQRAEAANGGATTTLLQLIDFNDGGDSVLADNDWQIKQTIDLSASASGWHTLSIDYDPTTGNVIAKYDHNTYNFTTATDLVGTFYVGYRENLPGTGNTVARPPTYDLYIAPAGVPGDYNNNGVVDAADYVLWRNGGPLQNEVSTIGSVTAEDYTAWRARFGNTSGSGSVQTAAAVPEPGTFLLVLAGAAMATAARRRSLG